MSTLRRWGAAGLLGSVGLVVYTYAGYPAVLAAVHRLRRPVAPTLPAMLPTVSIVVAAYDEEAAIGPRLRNLRDLDYPADRLEIVVVADGSSDGTVEVARGCGVRVLHRPRRAGKAAAINRGVEATTGEIIVFSDANNRYEPQTLRELLMPFGDPGVGVVTGSKHISNGSGRALDGAEGTYWRYESAIKRWESSIGSVTGVAGEVLAIRRRAFTPLAPGTVNDDFTLAMQAAIDGWRIAYAPRAVSLEPASATLDDETTRRARIVAGRYQALMATLPRLVRRRPLVAWQVVSHKGLRPMVPLAMAVAAVSNAVLLRSSVLARWSWAAQVLFYGLAGLGARAERRGRRPHSVTYVPYYFCRVNGSAIRGMAEVLSGRDASLWQRVARAESPTDDATTAVDGLPPEEPLVGRTLAAGNECSPHELEHLVADRGELAAEAIGRGLDQYGW
jgi:poly-beta-1,6-N-acetyl-D-glucosamine synthase